MIAPKWVALTLLFACVAVGIGVGRALTDDPKWPLRELPVVSR